MADTAVAITAGTGTNIDTRTEGTNSNHRQVVVLGDPATNAGVAPVDGTAGLKVDLGADNDVTVTSGTITTVSTVTAVTTVAAVTAITNALPAGTNAIGKLAANSGVDIGDVDITSVVPGVAATSLGKAEDAAHTSGDTGVLGLAVRRDANTSLVDTTGDYAPLQVDSTGNLKVAIISGAGSGGTSITDDAAFTVATTSLTPVGGIYKSALDAVDDGDAGAFAMTAKRAIYNSLLTPLGDSAMDDTLDAVNVQIVGDTVGSTVDTDDGSVAAAQANIALTIAMPHVYDGSAWVRRVGAHLIDDAAFTPGTSGVVVAGFEADESSTDSVDEGDAGAARMTLDRKQIVTPQPHTTGGLSTFMASGSDGSSILVATAQVIKASAGQMYGYYLYNPEAAVTFVHFYNTAAASVTVGTTNPLFTLAIPAGAAANLPCTMGITFSNAGWSCAATTTAGGNTAPSTGVSAVIWYA